MLCKTCEKSICIAFIASNALTSATAEVKNNISLHHSLLSFYKSVRSGCFICRQIWAIIFSCQKSFSSNIEYHQQGLQVSDPESYKHFRLQLRTVEAAAVHNGYSKRNILPSSNPLTRKAKQTVAWLTQHAFPLPPSHLYAKPLQKWIQRTQEWHSRSELLRFTIGSLHTPFIEIKGGTSAHQKWQCGFNFSPVSEDNFPPSPFDRRGFEVYGTSTASMPELWRHWFRSCSESHTQCRALEKKGFSPLRLVELLSDEEDKKTIKWRLSVRGEIDRDTKPVAYLTLSHCWGMSSHQKLTKKIILPFRSTLELPIYLKLINILLISLHR